MHYRPITQPLIFNSSGPGNFEATRSRKPWNHTHHHDRYRTREKNLWTFRCISGDEVNILCICLKIQIYWIFLFRWFETLLLQSYSQIIMIDSGSALVKLSSISLHLFWYLIYHWSKKLLLLARICPLDRRTKKLFRLLSFSAFLRRQRNYFAWLILLLAFPRKHNALWLPSSSSTTTLKTCGQSSLPEVWNRSYVYSAPNTYSCRTKDSLG